MASPLGLIIIDAMPRNDWRHVVAESLNEQVPPFNTLDPSWIGLATTNSRGARLGRDDRRVLVLAQDQMAGGGGHRGVGEQFVH